MFKLAARMLKLFATLSSMKRSTYYFDGPTKLFLDLYLAKFLNSFLYFSKIILFMCCNSFSNTT